MSLIKTFKEITKSDTMIAGGKGASLGEMARARISVPPGFVILSDAFEKFLKETDLNVEIDSILHSIDRREIHTIENASEKIKALILSAETPKDINKTVKENFKKLNSQFVAVRSSATAEDSSTAAWAGQLESYLNTTKVNLLENVKKCWASLFTPRAIFYRFEKELHKQKISVAVVVQKMVNSEKSGVAFSVHPVTQDKNQVIIEAGFGLGEAIVSGQITPDSYVVEKQPRRIIDKNIQMQSKGLYRSEKSGNEWRDIPKEQGEKQVLSDAEIMKLSEIILQIENHYGFPCDIEWAYEKNKFYVVQSRPITTLILKNASSVNTINYGGENWFLTISRNMSLWHQFLSDKGHHLHLKDFGVNAKLNALSIIYNGTQAHIFRHNPNYADFSKAVLVSVDSPEKIKALKEKYHKYAVSLEKSLNLCLKKFNKNNLTAFISEYQRFCAGLMLTATLGRIGYESLIEKLKAKNIPETEIDDIIATITYPEENTPLLLSQLEMLEIAKENRDFDGKLEKWLEKYQHIPVNFCGDPWNISDARKQFEEALKKDSGSEIVRIKENQKNKILMRNKRLNEIKDKKIKILAFAIAEGTYLNEFRKGVFSKISLNSRPIFKKIAKMCGTTNWRDCYFITPDEMISVLDNKSISLSELKLKRKIAVIVRIDNISIVLEGQEAESLWEKTKMIIGTNKNDTAVNTKKIIKGVSANKGCVKGIARLILTPQDFDNLKRGEILVTTMTSVDFIPVMERAAAFVTNEGGITSHASIVAREMNKPCVIGTKIATQILKDGDYIEVDANNGVVKILE